MTVTLPPDLEALVRAKVARGPYADPDHVIAEALRLLDERDRRARLRAAIAVADAQLDRGEAIPWTPDAMDRLIAEANERTRLGLPVKDDVKP